MGSIQPSFQSTTSDENVTWSNWETQFDFSDIFVLDIIRKRTEGDE
jgi:hypothetical protein